MKGGKFGVKGGAMFGVWGIKSSIGLKGSMSSIGSMNSIGLSVCIINRIA